MPPCRLALDDPGTAVLAAPSPELEGVSPMVILCLYQAAFFVW
jgi:hypothetical protein